VIFVLQFLVMDPDWIRIGIQPKMLDPDPYQMNTDPKHWFLVLVPIGVPIEALGFLLMRQFSPPILWVTKRNSFFILVLPVGFLVSKFFELLWSRYGAGAGTGTRTVTCQKRTQNRIK
jgi:hypothetical protein